MNTNNPDILFFVRREYGAPSIELRAYKVEKVNNEFAFLELNEDAYICPGLGDAGDRIFGTR